MSVCGLSMGCLLIVYHFPCVESFAVSGFRNCLLKSLNLAVGLPSSLWLLRIQAILNIICCCFFRGIVLHGLYFTNKRMLTAKALYGRRKLGASNFTSNLWTRVKGITPHIPLFIRKEIICRLKIPCIFLCTIIPLVMSRCLAHSPYNILKIGTKLGLEKSRFKSFAQLGW